MWNEGDTVLLRGMYEGRPVYIQSTRVVSDSPDETLLAIWPGALFMAFVVQYRRNTWIGIIQHARAVYKVLILAQAHVAILRCGFGWE